ncbi:hypothetical protein AMTR_s00088p00077170 [Amborella trichopoda]|uniref:Uncharacterized protein n=1 Tax=Amborella trichopoda TaxID=13333 RepID=W1NRD0_AMBTC|nr:hypothetical protein AMTR_s00088p00077170 [Amborella trichopoda]
MAMLLCFGRDLRPIPLGLGLEKDEVWPSERPQTQHTGAHLRFSSQKRMVKQETGLQGNEKGERERVMSSGVAVPL